VLLIYPLHKLVYSILDIVHDYISFYAYSAVGTGSERIEAKSSQVYFIILLYNIRMPKSDFFDNYTYV
jgi:hypothetical protein